MSDIKVNLGKRIKKLRKARSMTQEQLAELIFMDVTTLSKIETGKNYPQPETIEKLAQAFNVRIQDLFLIDKFESNDEFLSAIYENLEYVKSDLTKLKIIYDVSSALI